MLEVPLAPDPRQHVEAASARKVQVQQHHHRRRRRFGAGMGTFQIAHRVVAVAENVDWIGEIGSLQRTPDEHQVVGIVFDDEQGAEGG